MPAHEPSALQSVAPDAQTSADRADAAAQVLEKINALLPVKTFDDEH